MMLEGHPRSVIFFHLISLIAYKYVFARTAFEHALCEQRREHYKAFEEMVILICTDTAA